MAKSTSIEVDGHKFIAEVVSPRDGCWIVANITDSSSYLKPEVYGRIQDIVLSKCFYLRDAGGQQVKQVFWANGNILIPDIDFDLSTVDKLMKEAMDCSVGPTLRRLIAEYAAAVKEKQEADRQASCQPNSPQA